MLVPGDLGFRFVAVFIFVVFPAIFLFLRRQWRLAVARRDEINRLLVLASEEAAQAELEASSSSSSSIDFSYSFPDKPVAFAPVSAPVPSLQRLCAVCFTPTQNRCARCKSVHYCSGKCQIIHWRQGHKYKCTPSLVSYEDEETVNLSGSAVGQPHTDDYIGKTEGDPIKCVKKDDNAHKHGFTNHSPSSSVFAERGDHNTVTLAIHERELDVSAEFPAISVTSGARQSVPDDVVCTESISDDDSLHDINSNLHNSSSSFDNVGAYVSNNDVEEAKIEDGHTGVLYNRNISASFSPQEEVLDKKSASSGFNISYSNKKSIEPSISSSSFWDGSLEHARIRNDSCSNNVKPKFDGSGESKSSLSFSLQSSLDSPCKLSSDLHSQSVKASHHLHAGTSKADKLVEPILLHKGSMDAAEHRSSTNFSPGRPETRVKKFNVPEDLIKSNEVTSVADTLGCNDLPYCSAKGLSVLDKDTITPTLPSASDKAGLSIEISKGSSSSYVKKGNISSVVKTVKADGNGVIMPQSTSYVSSAPGGMKTSMLKVVEQLKAPKLSKQGVGVGRSIEKGIFPYELFVKLYHWNKVELRPCGLINCGNSCYANVVLQCLAFTPPLTAYLLEGLHTKSCVNKEWCFLCEFERLILKGKEGGSPISPIGILSQIQKIGSHLSNGREEDAHEFLRYAIDTMQYICLREARASASNPLEEETTLMGLTFGGYLRSKIKCTRCHGKSERQERMMDLTVEIGGDIETLEDALRQFTGTESLDGENKYHCGRCKSYEKAKKKLSISEAPNILTIALKRFQSGKFGKLNKSIRFPEILNLAPYMRGSSDKSPIYRLFGVVVHLDIMNASFSGHYVCYVRNTQNKWYKIDDSMVKVVESERVLNKGAYMLFYSRCSPRAPKSIRSNIISRDLANKTKNLEVGPSWTHERNTSRRRDVPVETNHINDDMANLGYLHQDETRRIPHILEFDSSSDNSSLFSHSDEVSSNTDSTRESICADDFSDFIFGWRPPSDSDSSSSSSSSSSSPLCTKHSPLSHSERYSSDLSEPSGSQTGNGKTPCWTCKAEELGSGAGVSFLQSNGSKQSRELVNSSDNRGGIDSRVIGRANPLDNMVSGVRLRCSSRKTG